MLWKTNKLIKRYEKTKMPYNKTQSSKQYYMKTKRNTTHYQHRHAKTTAIMRTLRKYVKHIERKTQRQTRLHTTKPERKKQSCGESKDYFKAGGQFNLNNLYGLIPPLGRRRLFCVRLDKGRWVSRKLLLNWFHLACFLDLFGTQS